MHTLTPEHFSALMAQGWSVLSEQPLRIQHDESGDEATGIAAIIVANQVVAEWDEEGSCVPAEDMGMLFQRLKALSNQAQHYIDVACQQARLHTNTDTESPAWETAFSLVFNPQLSDQVATLSTRMGRPLRYDDPNGSYADDVLAYAAALKEHVERLEVFLAPEPLAA